MDALELKEKLADLFHQVKSFLIAEDEDGLPNNSIAVQCLLVLHLHQIISIYH